MQNITLDEMLAKLPAKELEQSLNDFVAPMSELLPEKRLRQIVPLAVRGILTNETPVVAAMAQGVSRQEAECWAAAKRIYRFLENERFNHHVLFKGLYRAGQRTVAQSDPPYVVVALDPVNFEKPYTKALEGVSTVHKKTPPGLDGKARLARGYPAITATVVNTPVPAVTYANWFSYQTADFISQNREIQRAIRTTRWVLPDQKIRFVIDSGGDDQKVFAWIAKARAEFVITVSHLDRLVEVYNPRLDRWETEPLQDLVDSLPWEAHFETSFYHAGRRRMAKVKMGWLRVRLPNTQQAIWALVSENDLFSNTLVLLTNVPLYSADQAKAVYADWRLRGRIEHGYRFAQEQGLDVEDLRVRSLERMRRLFALVLLAAQFVFSVMHHWPAKAVLWLRNLGGKLNIVSDRDGPYILLRGLSSVWQTLVALSWATVRPFPHSLFPDI